MEEKKDNQTPTIVAAEDFDDDMAEKAADKLREAMKGLGTDERAIKKVTVGFSFAQRMVIKEKFTKKYERSLIEDLKSELRGKHEKLCVALWLESGHYDAMCIHDAIGLIRNDATALSEVVCTRTNAQIARMKALWKQKGFDGTLLGAVRDATDGSLGTLLTTILEESREGGDGDQIDETAMRLDVEKLYRALRDDDKEDTMDKFVDLLTTKSWAHIAAMSGVFLEVSNKYTMSGALEEAFGDSDSGTAMRMIVEFATQPNDFWAKRLRDAMEGLGTDNEAMRRVLVNRAEIDLADISRVFAQRYGDGKTLKQWIEEEVTMKGDYGALCIALCDTDK